MFNFRKSKKFSNQSSQKLRKIVAGGDNLYSKFIKKPLSIAMCCLIGFMGYKNISHSIETQEEHHEECTWTLTQADGNIKLDLGVNHPILPGHILKVNCSYGEGMYPFDDKYHYFSKNDIYWYLVKELYDEAYKNMKIISPTTIQWKHEYPELGESNISNFPLFEKVNKQVNIEKGKTSTLGTFSNVGCEKCLSSLNLSYIENETEISESEIVSANIDSSTGNISFSGLELGNSKIVVEAEGQEVADFDITVTEAIIPQEPQTPSDNGNGTTPSIEPQYLEAKVNIMDKTQRIRVYDPNKILPSNSKFVASVVEKHNNIDDTYKIENVFSYNLSLTDKNGTPLTMPLKKSVDLLFEIVDGLDKDELQLILVEQLKDIEFEEELVSLDGANWLKVKTNHFSPYALIDTLSEEEEAELLNNEKTNFVPTGDLETSLMILYSGIASMTSLGVLMKLSSKKKKSED